MKNKVRYILPAFFLFITFSYAQYPVTAIANNGPDDKRINFVFMGDGYTSAQQAAFINDSQDVTNDLFTQSPFLEYAAFFNTYAIEVPSTQSGADHPGNATDVSEPSHPVSNVNTAFDGTFDYFQIHRLLVPTNSSAVYTVLNNDFPNYDQVIILENTTHYGGSGGALATTSVHPSAPAIAIHEIGHSFAGLSDEYWAGDFYAGENYNMTQETNPASVRWKNWYGDNGIGIYSHFGGGSASSWYKPHQSCKMQSLSAPFCAVCKERIIDVIYSLVSPLENFAPSNAALVDITTAQTFDIDVIYPNPNTLTIEWTLNGVVVAIGTETAVLDETNLMQGMNTLTVTITDNTNMSRSYLPGNGYVFSETWQINYAPEPACANYVTVDNTAGGSLYHAAITLNSNATISNTGIIDFKAGTSIELESDFEVIQGGIFSATIEDCAVPNVVAPVEDK